MDGDENEQQTGNTSNDEGGTGQTGGGDGGGTPDEGSSLDRPGDVTPEIREGDHGENKAR